MFYVEVTVKEFKKYEKCWNSVLVKLFLFIWCIYYIIPY